MTKFERFSEKVVYFSYSLIHFKYNSALISGLKLDTQDYL
jgi:hypothetical protein